MKKYFKWTSIISLAIITSMVSVTSLGIFVSFKTQKTYGNINTEPDNETKFNLEEFFKSPKIDEQISNRYKLQINTQKALILQSLTNWGTKNINRPSFDDLKIKKNILFLITKFISLHSQFSIIKDYYINIKYELVHETQLKIDIRWAARQDLYDNKQNTKLYWDKINLQINESDVTY